MTKHTRQAKWPGIEIPLQHVTGMLTCFLAVFAERYYIGLSGRAFQEMNFTKGSFVNYRFDETKLPLVCCSTILF